MAKQALKHWNLGCSRVEDINHCLIVGAKKDMGPGEVRAPHVSGDDDREQLFIGYRVRGLRRNPRAAEPLPTEVGTKAKGT